LLDKGISNLFSEPDPAVNRVELEKLKDQLQDEESPEELIEK
jgi:hypothetical protein